MDTGKSLPPLPSSSEQTLGSGASDSGVDFETTKTGQYADDCPALNIAIFIVGSRGASSLESLELRWRHCHRVSFQLRPGDVQPYVALALGLIKSRGHRVRLATHGEFKDFVLKANEHLAGLVGPRGESLEGKLEFFDAGGDPRELMAYMVKSELTLCGGGRPHRSASGDGSAWNAKWKTGLTVDPGLMPGIGSIVNGDVFSKRKMTAEYIKGFYKATFFPDARNGPFAADAIISNPPAFAHIHVAQCLGIPLHMSFSTPSV